MSVIESETTDRALMIISDTTIRGTTRLQKYGFLLRMQYDKELKNISEHEPKLTFYDDWEPLWYGPFSKSLKEDVDKCRESKLINVTSVDKILKTQQYSFTIKGRIRWRKILTNHKKEMEALYEKITNLQKMRLERLLEGVYYSYPKYTERSTIIDRFKQTD